MPNVDLVKCCLNFVELQFLAGWVSFDAWGCRFAAIATVIATTRRRMAA